MSMLRRVSLEDRLTCYQVAQPWPSTSVSQESNQPRALQLISLEHSTKVALRNLAGMSTSALSKSTDQRHPSPIEGFLLISLFVFVPISPNLSSFSTKIWHHFIYMLEMSGWTPFGTLGRHHAWCRWPLIVEDHLNLLRLFSWASFTLASTYWFA
jgi:hypothetical protein